jgi:hypothetical protein
MSTKVKKTLNRISLALFGVIILFGLLGIIFFPRTDLPPIIQEEICAASNIHFNTTSLEMIYLDPESVLADPEKFLQEDPAYLLLAKHRDRISDPFPFATWVNKIEALASKPEVKRKQMLPFRLYELITATQQSFCQEVQSYVLAYLPRGTDYEVTIYLTALEGSAPAYADGDEIVFSLSHPLFANAQIIHEPTGLSSFYNLALHELFHIGFGDAFEGPSLEEHIENEVVIDILIALQNEGIATHISYQLSSTYPSPFEWFLYLIDQKPIVQAYINGINELLSIAQTKPTGKAYDDIYRQIGSLGYRWKGLNIVGAYMAMTIETEFGRAALAQTVSGEYDDFTETYNSIADKDMKIHWKQAP